jgi:hypothetical protein
MFNLEYEDYVILLEDQDYVCAICKQEEKSVRNKNLAVDHCHVTNAVRGLLCSNCNRAIGLLKDSVDIVKEVLNYLIKYKGVSNEIQSYSGA